MTRLVNRVLPIYWAPLPGEALESWLAAFANRLEVTWGEMLDAVLPVPPEGKRESNPGSLSAALRPDEVASIAAATGIAPDAVLAMTLGASGNSALKVDIVSRHVATPWGDVYRQRFCPRCLSQNAGRWSLEWRLPWVTVCLKHHCFLHDRCRACGQEFNIRSGWFNAKKHPQPDRCRCSEHLGAAPLDVLPVCHPVLLLQRRLASLLTRQVVRSGVYRTRPVSSAQLLADVRLLALRILGTATPQTLAEALRSTGPSGEPQYWAERLDTTIAGRVGWSLSAPAPVGAAGVAAALNVLLQPSFEAAAAALQLVAAADKSHQIRPGRSKLGFKPSPALIAVEVVSRADHYGPVDALRYRLMSSRPRYPVRPPDRVADSLARAVPTMFWPEWSLALPVAPKNQAWVTRRQILSWLLLETGSRRTERSIRRELGCSLNGQRAHEAARMMSQQPEWPAIATALVRLHDYLAAHPPRVDYQRRRTLDYSGLLPVDQWEAIFERANFTPRSGYLYPVARAWLFERISTMPANAHGFGIGATGRTSQSDSFLRSLTVTALDEIDCVATRFLADNDITDEPVVWSPPRKIASGLLLPGCSLESISDRELGSILQADKMTLTKAARQLGVPVEAVRHRLEQAAVPGRRPARQTHFARAQQALSQAHLRHLYLEQGRSLTEIAREFGLPKVDYVSRLAKAYGIPLRSEPRDPIPADWIYACHVGLQRTVGEMAAELGDSPERVRYWAKKHGIALRTYCRTAPYSDVERQARRLHIYDLLLPVIADKKGWRRLQRFALLAQYSSFGEAARALGCGRDTLSAQVDRLEHAFGRQLVQRAPSRSQPMRLCDFGQQMVAATRRIQRALDADDDTKTDRGRKSRTV
jgi:molybdenum-dependent DNA-binding transcriptional regulator ModE